MVMGAHLVNFPGSFPTEVVQHTLTFCHPFDVAAFSRSCRKARDIIFGTNDQYLWRALFLALPFDDPSNALQARYIPWFVETFDWKVELQKRFLAKAILIAGDNRAQERVSALQTLLSAIETALPVACDSSKEPSPPSHNLTWVRRVVVESKLLETDQLEAEINLCAKFRSYLSLSLDCDEDEEARERLRQRRLRSRCFVYDLRNYRVDNQWGPYDSETGGVNWVHVESIINVVLMNAMELPSAWASKKPPIGLEATRAYSAPGLKNRKPEDWAGVEGTWRRLICFMDYRDLFAYNYATFGNHQRHPSFFHDNFLEATRLIDLSLKIVPEEQASVSIRFRRPPGKTLDDIFPPIYFSGFQHGVHGAEATIDGCVRMGEDGIAKWQFVMVYAGFSQWSSEGVQIGNLASAAGVVAIWSGAQHEQGDPIGPYWLWKIGESNDST